MKTIHKAKELEIGSNYHVVSGRKGLFKLNVSQIDGRWITGTVLQGKVKSPYVGTVKNPGEQVIFLEHDCKFIPTE